MSTTALDYRPGSAIEPVRPGRRTAATKSLGGCSEPSRPVYRVDYIQQDNVAPEQLRRILARTHMILFSPENSTAAVDKTAAVHANGGAGDDSASNSPYC